jgi:signal transduction histidine kinase
MGPNSVRIAVLPRDVATEVLTAAMSRASWVVSIAILLLDVPVVIEIVIRRTDGAHLAVPLLALGGMLVLLAYTGLRPSTTSRTVFLVAGALLAGLYQVSLLVADPALADVGSHVLNRPAFVLVLVSPGIVRPIAALRWVLTGYAVATATLLVSDLIVGVPLATGWGPTLAFVLASSAYLVLAGIRASQESQLPDLGRLEAEMQRLALEHQYEQRAAAVIHDTVLSDLSAVMNAHGPLDDRTRARLRSDVATLGDAAWLRETRTSVELDRTDAALRNELVGLIGELQWRGLTVDLTGGSDEEIARLSADNISRAVAAVRACLENVLLHAHVSSVELVLSAGNGVVSIMVIDQGVGFVPEEVANDRLGLRGSVVRRVEDAGGSVRIWSKPGSGTSVMITLPSGEAE